MHANTASRPLIDKADLIRRLRTILPAASLLHEPEDLRPYECDGLSAYRQLPLVVALPDREAQVCDILRVCQQYQVPVVARGAGTGLSGGALPASRGVLLVMAKFNRILSIDPPWPALPGFSPACAIWLSRKRRPRMDCITRLTLRARSPALSAAMSPKIRVGYIA